jgi:hypothetical protein
VGNKLSFSDQNVNDSAPMFHNREAASTPSCAKELLKSKDRAIDGESKSAQTVKTCFLAENDDTMNIQQFKIERELSPQFVKTSSVQTRTEKKQ